MHKIYALGTALSGAPLFAAIVNTNSVLGKSTSVFIPKLTKTVYRLQNGHNNNIEK